MVRLTSGSARPYSASARPRRTISLAPGSTRRAIHRRCAGCSAMQPAVAAPGHRHRWMKIAEPPPGRGASSSSPSRGSDRRADPAAAALRGSERSGGLDPRVVARDRPDHRTRDPLAISDRPMATAGASGPGGKATRRSGACRPASPRRPPSSSSSTHLVRWCRARAVPRNAVPSASERRSPGVHRIWPDFRALVSRYRAFSGFWPTASGTRSITATPCASIIETFAGLFVISRICEKPMRRRISAPSLKVPLVILETQPMVGLDRIESLILKGVGAHLVGEPDAPPLLIEVEEQAIAGLAHHVERRMQLRTAIAFQRPKHVACETGRMQPHKRRPVARRASDLDGVVFLSSVAGAEHVDLARITGSERHPAMHDRTHRGVLFEQGRRRVEIQLGDLPRCAAVTKPPAPPAGDAPPSPA